MVYRKLGKSNIEASAIGLGAWAIGGGPWWGDSDDEQSIETIRQAVESGITLIDTAPCYGFGRSEEVVGKAIKGIRDKVVISTKCGLWWNDDRGSLFFEQDGKKVKRCLDPDTIKQEIELSLNRLDISYIDVYFTHWQSMPPYETPIADTMKCLMDLKAQGLIRAIGASNVTAENILEYQKHGQLDVIQEKYSMIDRRIESELIPTALAEGVSTMAYSPIEQGLLTGKITMETAIGADEARNASPWYKPVNRKKVLDMLDTFAPLTQKYNCSLANLVVAWTMAQPGMTYTLCGARKPEHIAETAKSAIAIDQTDIEFMRKAAEQLTIE